MPRGVKGSGTPKPAKKIKSLDERFAELDLTIETLTKQLSKAKAQRKALIAEKEKAEAHVILNAIKSSGMGTQEILDLIQKK